MARQWRPDAACSEPLVLSPSYLPYWDILVYNGWLLSIPFLLVGFIICSVMSVMGKEGFFSGF